MDLTWPRRFFFSQLGFEGASKHRPAERKTAAPSEAKRSWIASCVKRSPGCTRDSSRLMNQLPRGLKVLA